MPSHSMFGTRIKRLFAYPIAVVAFFTLLASSARAQWTVNVDVSNLTAVEIPPSSVTPNNSQGAAHTCTIPPQSAPNHGDLFVCPNDTVTWIVKTKNGRGEIAVVDRDGVLGATGAHGSPVPGTGTVATVPVHIAGSPGTHQYAVAVYDPDGQSVHVYVLDPVIVIGG